MWDLSVWCGLDLNWAKVKVTTFFFFLLETGKMLQGFLKLTSPKKQPECYSGSWLPRDPPFQNTVGSSSGTCCFLLGHVEAARKAWREIHTLSVDRDACHMPAWEQTAARGGWKCIRTIFRRSGLCNIQKAFSICFKFLKLLWWKGTSKPHISGLSDRTKSKGSFLRKKGRAWSTEKSSVGTRRHSPPSNSPCCGCCLVTQSRPTLCDPMDYSPPGSSVHGILQARILKWVAMPSSRGPLQPRDLPNPGSPALQADSLPVSHQGGPLKDPKPSKLDSLWTALLFHASEVVWLSGSRKARMLRQTERTFLYWQLLPKCSLSSRTTPPPFSFPPQTICSNFPPPLPLLPTHPPLGDFYPVMAFYCWSLLLNELPGTSPTVEWLRLRLLMQGLWVGSLVRELRSHMPHGQKSRN